LDSVPWDLAEAEDTDLWRTQWNDLFFATVHDTVCTVQWRRRKMKNWLSSATIQLIRFKCLCYKKLKKMFNLSSKPSINFYATKLDLLLNLIFKLMQISSLIIYIVVKKLSGTGLISLGLSSSFYSSS